MPRLALEDEFLVARKHACARLEQLLDLRDLRGACAARDPRAPNISRSDMSNAAAGAAETESAGGARVSLRPTVVLPSRPASATSLLACLTMTEMPQLIVTAFGGNEQLDLQI